MVHIPKDIVNITFLIFIYNNFYFIIILPPNDLNMDIISPVSDPLKMLRLIIIYIRKNKIVLICITDIVSIILETENNLMQ